MRYQDLEGPTPFNYRPDDESAKLQDPGLDSRVKIIQSAFHKKRDFDQYKRYLELEGFLQDKLIESTMKKKPVKKRLERTVTVIGKEGKPVKVQMPDQPIGECEPEKDEQLIQIGGLAGWNEEVQKYSDSRRTFDDFMQNVHESKKRKELTKSQKRSAKIKRLQDTDQWPGLE